MAQNEATNLGYQLGQLIFGRPDDGMAAIKGQMLGAQVRGELAGEQDKMASAREHRAKAILGETQNTGLTSMRDSLVAVGYTPEQADLISNAAMANGGANLQNAMGSAMMAQIPVAGTAAVPQLGDDFQRALGRETTKITDGQAYNPLGDSSQQVHLTALGDATVGEKRAGAAEKYASAAAHNAQARLYGVQADAGGFNPHTGGGDAPPLPAIDPNGPKGDAYLASLDPTIAAQVKALDEGRQAFPTGTALKSPYWQAMLQHVAQYDPEFDAVNYNARAGTRKGFTSGKEAQTINSLNTVAEHLGTFSDYADSLGNFSSLGPLTHLANKLKNGYLEASGDPRIAQFNTAKKAVADEVAKVWRASGGSQADIEENLHNLDGAQSPEQLNAAIGTLTKLIAGKIAALHDQYRSGMGRAADQQDFVSPGARDAFERTLKRGGYDVGAFESTTGGSPALGDAVTGGGAAASGAPQPGHIEDGYRFKGGDPANPANWEKL